MKLRPNEGFTLLELLIAAYILLIGICGILSLVTNTMLSSESAWDMTVATTHAQHILEEMQSKNNLLDITSTDWNVWAQKEKLNTLPKEHFRITFGDLSQDPLEIHVITQWERKGRINQITLNTKLTK